MAKRDRMIQDARTFRRTGFIESQYTMDMTIMKIRVDFRIRYCALCDGLLASEDR